MQFQSPFYLILLNLEGNRIRTRKGMQFCTEGLTINSTEGTKFGSFGLRGIWSQIKVSTELIPSEGSEEESSISLPWLMMGCWQLWVFLGL